MAAHAAKLSKTRPGLGATGADYGGASPGCQSAPPPPPRDWAAKRGPGRKGPAPWGALRVGAQRSGRSEKRRPAGGLLRRAVRRRGERLSGPQVLEDQAGLDVADELRVIGRAPHEGAEVV